MNVLGIPANRYERLARSIVRNLDRDDVINQIEAVINFVDAHELDLEDAATLMRIASGEGNQQEHQP